MNQSEYAAMLIKLQEDIKPSQSRYMPSGETPPASIALLIPLSLLVAGVCYAVARPICLLFYELVGDSGGGGGTAFNRWNEGRWIALGIIVVNGIVLTVIAYATIFSFKLVAYLTKLRNPKIGKRFAFFSVFVVCAVLYLPLFGGHSLAPTDITILFIPVRWVLMILGCLVVPLIVSYAVEDELLEMKFCEKTGYFLKKVAHVTLTWEQGKCLIQVLQDKQYDLLPGLLNSQWNGKAEFRSVTFTLFGHPKAEVAYVDVVAKFEICIGSATNATSSSWLVYHQKLSRDEAKGMSALIPSGVRRISL